MYENFLTLPIINPPYPMPVFGVTNRHSASKESTVTVSQLEPLGYHTIVLN